MENYNNNLSDSAHHNELLIILMFVKVESVSELLYWITLDFTGTCNRVYGK